MGIGLSYKNISISTEVYNRLKALKEENESFNVLLEKFAAGRKSCNLHEFFGKWKLTAKDEAAIARELKKMWGTWNESIGY
ncbi:MAG: antitoxin VapB family protein [Candidatus Micrarchaeota archaeon]